MTEILAPAGGREQLLAAVRCGANAVYLGAKNFNARRNAENFEEESLAETVAFCHARNVAVHVALNTLVMDHELPLLEAEAASIAESGADAVIVQDLAAAKLIRECCPGIALHASTQMTVHNLAGIRMLEDLGFSRVVLARELSYEEIAMLTEKAGIETEVFVHGALCMCVSGGCYLSSVLGGRSGNRGLCAQPCRLDFDNGERGHALSLKDMSYISHIKELADAGVASLKIEGRMKRPEYVAAAVTACREALAGREPDLDTLKAVFSRQGFTDGYYTGRRTPEMFGYRSREDVTAAEPVLKELSHLYAAERQTIPVEMALSVFEGTESVLTVSDGKACVSVGGAVPEKAVNRPTDRELAERSLFKTGGTPFFAESLNFSSDGESVLPVSELNRMRREALDQLLAEREHPVPKPFLPCGKSEPIKHKASFIPELRLRFETYGQTASFSEEEGIPLPAETKVILPISEILKNPGAAARFGGALIAELPALIFPKDEEALSAQLEALKELGLQNALAENLGAIRLIREAGFRPYGGHGLNILNSVALAEYEKLGLTEATVSFELPMAKISRLGGTLPRGILGYGTLPLMRFRACPIQKKGGCGNCPGSGTLTDRLGKTFSVLCSGRRYATLLNSLPLWIADKEISGADFLTLYFTVESPERCLSVYQAYQKNMPPDTERTNGLYFRELL
ncbi:MAG TPA: DUF3656 domain-containing protein [Oscillospiraceae bacterium]|nr:DUF3656 domain-containing protein [Oscillospiraceae bacterium]HRW56792.1 DUF3656 domain-containing protein [Oscillospiraceae bacterium]